MLKIIKDEYSPPVTIPEYVNSSLTPWSAEDDVYELRTSIDTLRGGVGRLCEVLAEKKILTAEEIGYIAKGYQQNYITFAEEPE